MKNPFAYAAHFSWLILILALAVSIDAKALSPAETPPSRWSKGNWGFSASTEYFQTNANYEDYKGSFQRLPGDNSLSSFESSLRLRYGLTNRTSIYTGFGFTQVRAVDSVLDKSNSGISDIFLGANFLLWTKWIRVVPELQVGSPLNLIERGQTEPQTEPLISDGTAYARAGLHLSKSFRYLTLYGYLGMHVPSEGLAKLGQYALSTEVHLGRSFALGGGISGYETVMNDELTYAERRRTTNAANAGSARFYAYDPSLLEGRVWVTFKPDRLFQIRAGYGKTIDGVRAAEGQSILVSLSFNQLPIREKPESRGSDRQKRAKRKRDEAAKNFKVETEKTDPSFFQEEDFPDIKEDPLNDTEKMLESQQEE